LKEAVAWNAKEKRDKSDMKVVWRKTAEFHLKGKTIVTGRSDFRMVIN
jgi:hypothetical protein